MVTAVDDPLVDARELGLRHAISAARQGERDQHLAPANPIPHASTSSLPEPKARGAARARFFVGSQGRSPRKTADKVCTPAKVRTVAVSTTATAALCRRGHTHALKKGRGGAPGHRLAHADGIREGFFEDAAVFVLFGFVVLERQIVGWWLTEINLVNALCGCNISRIFRARRGRPSIVVVGRRAGRSTKAQRRDGNHGSKARTCSVHCGDTLSSKFKTPHSWSNAVSTWKSLGLRVPSVPLRRFRNPSQRALPSSRTGEGFLNLFETERAAERCFVRRLSSRRLAAQIPKPRVNLVLYAGVLVPHAARAGGAPSALNSELTL